MNDVRDSLFYMTNLGSEVARVLRSYRAGSPERTEQSLLRAEKILDTLATMPDMRTREGEIAALRSLLEDIRSGNLGARPEHIEAYFLPFALRAMRRQ